MTNQQILSAVENYRKYFEGRRIEKFSYPHNHTLIHTNYGLEHCHDMLDKIVQFVENGKIDKAFRWLGFLQGALWMAQIYPIAYFKDQNHNPQK